MTEGGDPIKQEIENLQLRLAALIRQQNEVDSEREPDCVSWNPYEQFIGEAPIEFIRLGREAIETTLNYIKNQNLAKLKGCLRFFDGDNLITKKAKLIRFLKRAPTYKTKNLKLLEQRLYITKKWMKENNFQGPFEDLPLSIPIQNEDG